MLLSLLRLRPYLEQTGWFESVENGMPVDREGNCLPWYTYPAFSFPEASVTPEMVIFEYSSGDSTLRYNPGR